MADLTDIPGSVCSSRQRWSAESTSRFFHPHHPLPSFPGSFGRTLCRMSILPFCNDRVSRYRTECKGTYISRATLCKSSMKSVSKPRSEAGLLMTLS